MVQMESRRVGVRFMIFCIAAVCLVDSCVGCIHPIIWRDLPDLNAYSIWANSTNFTVNVDSIHFFFDYYGGESALLVSEEDYRSCNTKNPIKLYSGEYSDDTLKLNRPGYYYFISGKEGNCQKGLKMCPLVKEVQPGQILPPPSQSDRICWNE